MLQAEKADDSVIATGETRSVRDFLEKTFALLDPDYRRYVEHEPHCEKNRGLAAPRR